MVFIQPKLIDILLNFRGVNRFFNGKGWPAALRNTSPPGKSQPINLGFCWLFHRKKQWIWKTKGYFWWVRLIIYIYTLLSRKSGKKNIYIYITCKFWLELANHQPCRWKNKLIQDFLRVYLKDTPQWCIYISKAPWLQRRFVWFQRCSCGLVVERILGIDFSMTAINRLSPSHVIRWIEHYKTTLAWINWGVKQKTTLYLYRTYIHNMFIFHNRLPWNTMHA